MSNGSHIRPAKRWRIYERDEHRCFYCGKRPKSLTGMQLDHMITKRYTGKEDNDEENLVSCCVSCNNKKGYRSVEQWAEDLLGLKPDQDWEGYAAGTTKMVEEERERRRLKAIAETSSEVPF